MKNYMRNYWILISGIAGTVGAMHLAFWLWHEISRGFDGIASIATMFIGCWILSETADRMNWDSFWDYQIEASERREEMMRSWKKFLKGE